MSALDLNPDNKAYVPQPPANPPATEIIPTGALRPFSAGSGTYAVSASVSNPVNIQVNTSPIRLRSFSIVPLSSAIAVAFYFRYGSWSIGTNPPVVNSTFTLAGVAYTKDFKDGTGRYPQLNAGDVIQLILIASGSGYVTVDIDGEYA